MENIVSTLLPIGSIVKLKGERKKIMISGVMQFCEDDEGNYGAYDYLGLPYPEGYVDEETQILFDHTDIKKVIFKGYEDKERETFVKRIDKFYQEDTDNNEADEESFEDKDVNQTIQNEE